MKKETKALAVSLSYIDEEYQEFIGQEVLHMKCKVTEQIAERLKK